MYLHFREEFDLPISEIFPYFETPSAWAKLYGMVKPVKILRDDWHAIPLKAIPFPLMAKNVECHHERSVRWIFGGFWRGVGEVNFYSENDKTIVEGFEYITPHGAWLISSLLEKHFMEEEFARIWNLGWKRIRKNEKGESNGQGKGD
jgi:hypothetical protein